MATRTSRLKGFLLADNDPERLRLLSWTKILLFTALIVAVMVLLYPRDDLIAQVEQSSGRDRLSRTYLDNLLKGDPGNSLLRVKQAEVHIDARRPAEAERLLTSIGQPDDAELRLRLARAWVELRTRQAYDGSEAEREQYLPALHQALSVLAGLQLGTDERTRLAAQAQAHGAGELALRLRRELAETAGPDEQAERYGQAAAAALALGRHRDAADYSFKARRVCGERACQAAFYLDGVRALEAADRPLEALDAAERELGDLADERDILLHLVRLARAANRNDLAEIYVRRLLRQAGVRAPAGVDAVPVRVAILGDAPGLSRRLPVCTASQSEACWQRRPGSTAAFLSPLVQAVSAVSGAAFDDTVYTLAYEVFLANGKQAEALDVARAAVRKAPALDAWRERLARVAEWNGEVAEAVAQWRHLALKNDSDQAWTELLRLAPGVFDEETVALALMREHRRGRLDEAGIARLVQAFEAAGEPRQGLDLLVEANRVAPRRALMLSQARLESRLGLEEQAIASLRRLDSLFGLDRAGARELAAMLVGRGQLAEAYQELAAHQGASADSDYQGLMAELAWRLQERDSARRIYQSMRFEERLRGYETERLVMLLRDDNPDAAARVALRHWESNRLPRFLRLAADIYLGAGNLAAASATLKRDVAGDDPDYLRLRAEVYRRGGQLAAAAADIARAESLRPDDARLQAQLLWLRIDARDRAGLAADMRRLEPLAAERADLWAPLAAGYVLLGQPAHALPYYARQASARQDDYLWQLGYAGILDEAGQADLAWRLRRQAWLKLRRPARFDAGQREQWRAVVELALRQAPGDAGAAWLREWLRLDAQGGAARSPEAKELALAWFLSTEQYEPARLWLLREYGRQLRAPRWAEVTLALHDDDRAALRRLLDGEDDGVDAGARIEAAMRLREHGAARRLAGQALVRDPGNDFLRLQLADSLWRQQQRAGLAWRREEQGALDSEGWRADGQWSMAPRLRMGLTLSGERLRANGAGLLAVPENDRRLDLNWHADHDEGETDFSLGHRDALDRFVSLGLTHRRQVDPRLDLRFGLGYRQAADETAALRVGAWRDRVSLGVDWRPGRREFLSAEWSASRYHGQDGEPLGRGNALQAQLGYRVRMDYPDATLRLHAASYRFDPQSGAGGRFTDLLPDGATALPEDSRQFGLGLGLGESASDRFSRTWRPFASFDLLHGSEAGMGYGVGLGFVTSPTGRDWLRGQYRNGRDRLGGDEDVNRFDLEYRYLF